MSPAVAHLLEEVEHLTPAEQGWRVTRVIPLKKVDAAARRVG